MTLLASARPAAAALAALVCLAAGDATATTLPAGFTEDVVASGFVAPTAFAALPDGRFLVTEKRGTVRMVANGQLLATPFLDISAKVNASFDRGLVGLAIDPDFATNGHVYLYYVHEQNPARPQDAKTARLIRVTASGNVANPASELIVLGSRIGPGCTGVPVGGDCIPSDWQGHNGGDIEFGSDGTLWLAIGDGSSPNNVNDNTLRAQNLDSLAGKLVHVTKTGAGLPSNPFWNGDAAHSRSKVFAYGLRNPFRFTLHPGTGTPFIGDVGWSTWEEIDRATPGANFGWPCYEGGVRQSGYEPKAVCQSLYAQGPGAVTLPLVSYDHALGSSVMGGPFYNASAFPAQYQGAYFYGDYSHDWIRYLKVDAAGTITQPPALFATGAGGPVDIEVGADAALYFLAINAGELRRIRHTAGNTPPVAAAAGNPTNGLAPLDVEFTSAGSRDPDGDPLTYAWNFGDGTPTSSQANPSHRYTASGSYTATLTLSDNRGGTDVATLAVTVGNRAPVATIVAPTPSTLYRIGQPIALEGSATDPDQGALPDSAYSWTITLKHCPAGVCHDHPSATATGPHASFTPIDHGDDVHFEVSLTVTDSGGLTDVETVAVNPQTVQISLATQPAGLQLVYDGETVATPFSRATPVGSTHTLFAPSPQGGAQFASWSDGGSQQHDVTIWTANASFTATFTGAGGGGGDVYNGFVTDSGCGGCSAALANGELHTTIAGGADSLDTAYGWRDAGEQQGRVYTRHILRLANGQTLGGDLIVHQLLDTANRIIYQLSLNAARRLLLYSPAGGLRATAISATLPVTIPNNGTNTRIEVSALRNNSITVRTDGVDRHTITGLTGATTTNPHYLRIGIIRYATTTTNEPVTTHHDAVDITTTGWLGDPGGGGDTTPPAAPSSLVATGGQSGVALDWADSVEADLAGYRVFRAGASSGPFTLLTPALLTTSSYTDATAPAGVVSYYRVTAVDFSGNESPPATANATRPAPTGDVYNGFVTDSGCGGCSAALANGELHTTIAGGADSLDTAYGWRDAGEQQGRVYTRHILRLANGQTLGGDLIVHQLLDTANRIIYQLSLNAARRLLLYSPAGGLRATAISATLPVTIPNNGTNTRIEVSALRNNSITVRTDGVDRHTITGLTGATTTNPHYLRIGIIRYATTTTNEPVTTHHDAVDITTTGWLGAP